MFDFTTKVEASHQNHNAYWAYPKNLFFEKHNLAYSANRPSKTHKRLKTGRNQMLMEKAWYKIKIITLNPVAFFANACEV